MKLRASIFNKLCDIQLKALMLQVLCMTIIFNDEVLNLVTKMIDLPILTTNIFWGNCRAFIRRNICITQTYNQQMMCYLKNLLISTLLRNSSNQAIICPNTARECKIFHIKVHEWMFNNSKLMSESVLTFDDQKL